jgi:hypothetical protein
MLKARIIALALVVAMLVGKATALGYADGGF